MRLLYHLPLLLSAFALPSPESVQLQARGVGTLGAGAWAGADAGGPRIKGLQHLLNSQGQGVDVDGKFGPKTSSAVVAVQKKHGLAADGKPGPATLGAIVDVVKLGSKGGVVSAAQETLNGGLSIGLGVDGSFGTATREATIQYQASHSLQQDGVIGKNTWTALFKGGKPTPNPSPTPPPNPGPVGVEDHTGRCPKRIIDLGVTATPNGCGPQNFPDLIPDGALGKCCDAHDRCYADCSRSKKDCDDSMGSCGRGVCKALFSDWVTLNICLTQVKVYTKAVELWGKGPFENATKKHCKCVG